MFAVFHRQYTFAFVARKEEPVANTSAARKHAKSTSASDIAKILGLHCGLLATPGCWVALLFCCCCCCFRLLTGVFSVGA